VVGAIAANRAIYSVGMGAPLSEIQGKWDHAIAHPSHRASWSAPSARDRARGRSAAGEGKGLDRLPIPISTPGFDSAPTLTATNVITRDPETACRTWGPTAPPSNRPIAWWCAWRRASAARAGTSTT